MSKLERADDSVDNVMVKTQLEGPVVHKLETIIVS